MKLTGRKEMIREIFNDDEVAEIRAALSDRYDTLTKMADKEAKHGRKYDDRSWPRERLAILDGNGLRAGVIDVFNSKSPDEVNGDLFEEDDDDAEEVSISSMVNRPNSITPQYENDPWDCPHTEILDLTEDGDEVPRFKCSLCGTDIRALATGGAVDPATLHPDRDPAEATLEAIRSVVRIPPYGRARALEVLGAWTAGERIAAFDWAARVGTPAGLEESIPDHVQALFDAVMAVKPAMIAYECPACGNRDDAPEGLRPRCSRDPDCPGVMIPADEIVAAQKAVGTYRQETPDEDDVVEADYEIVDERPEEERAQDPEPLPFEPIPLIPTLEELDALTLEELGIPTRARNILAKYGIKTAADYLAAGDAALALPGIGHITLDEINQALRDRGLTEQAARQIEAELVAAGRAFVGAMSGGETEEIEETPIGTLYDRVLSVACPTCSASNRIGAGEVCVTVGGNPRSGFHAVRVRAAVQAGAISPDEYDAAYDLHIGEDEPEDVPTSEDELPWEQIGNAFNGELDDQEEPGELTVLEPMEWPQGPPEIGQRVYDFNGRYTGLTIGGVSERYALVVDGADRPVGSLRLGDIRWVPVLECWGWGTPAAAGV